MKAKLLSKRKLHLAFASSILTSLVAGAISRRGILLRRESDQWVRYTQVLTLQDEALRQAWWRQ